MTKITERLQNERVKALKAKEKERASFLSTMLSEIKSFEINSRVNGVENSISEEKSIEVFNKMLKSRNESISIFSKNGRLDLVEKEQYQINIISEFVPKKLTEVEIDAEVKFIYENTEDKTMKNMMPILKNKFGQNADMSIVRKSLEKLLS